uniref:OTU domain-containing protein n=1 Tax=viral metagenome TaxID=1070528 RepID=A0A6C0BQD9_9ZZZZ
MSNVNETNGNKDKHSKMTILDVDTEKVYENKYLKNLYKIGVHGDGTCLIHSFLYLMESKYRKLSVSNKHMEGLRYRKELVKVIVKSLSSNAKYRKRIKDFFKNVYDTLDHDEYPDIETYIHTKLEDPSEYLEESFIIFLELLKLVNIVILKDGEFYPRVTDYMPDRDTILISNIEDTHFEPIAIKKNNKYTYILSTEDDKSMIDKIIRAYRKTKRREYVDHISASTASISTKASTASEKNEGSPDDDDDDNKGSPDDDNDDDNASEKKTEKEIIPLNQQPVIVQMIETVREDTPSTQQDYYETMIAEDEIIFEEISDLNEITLVRVDKNAPFSYSIEQASHEINTLYDFYKTPLNSTQNQNFIKLLNEDPSNQSNMMITMFNSLIPVVNAKKEFSTESLVNNMTDKSSEYFYKNRTEYFEDFKQLLKNDYKKFASDYLEIVQFLYPLNSKPSFELRDREIVRVCPDRYDEFLKNTIDKDTLCYRFDYAETEEIHNLKNTQILKRIKDVSLNQINTIKTENYLEIYKPISKNINITGFFISCRNKRHTKFSPNSFHIVNVDRYFDKILNLKVGDTVTLHFCLYSESKQVNGRVSETENGIITINVDKPVLYKGKFKSTVYFNTNLKQLKDNWFSLNKKNNIQFEKRYIFEKDILCIFDTSKDKWNTNDRFQMLSDLIIPNIDEFFYLQRTEMRDLYNLSEISEFTKEYYDYNYERDTGPVLQSKVLDILKSNISRHKEIDLNASRFIKIPYKNYRLSSASNLQFKYMDASYYRELKNQTKHLDSELHRIHLLHRNIDNGMAHFMAFIKHGLVTKFTNSKETKNDLIKKINLYESELKSIVNSVDTQVTEKYFYSQVKDLLQVKKQLMLNKKQKQLESTLTWMRTSLNSQPINEESMNLFATNVWNFYKINLKPQSYKNVSFLKDVNKVLNEEFSGNLQETTLEESFGNLENSRVLNFESIGTYQKDDIKEDKNNNNSNFKTINMYISEISHHFGMIKITKQEQDYIEKNSHYIGGLLLEEKKRAVLKNNPKLKDFSKMFKSEKDKLMYLEYTKIIIVISFMLIFININRRKIELYKIHSKCREFFALQGYPLTSFDKTNNKSTIGYLACLIKTVYKSNTLLSDQDRNKQKIVSVVNHILKFKPELRKTLSKEKLSFEKFMESNDNDHSDQILNYYSSSISKFLPNNKMNKLDCNIHKISENLIPNVTFKLPDNTNPLQLVITRNSYPSKFEENVIVISDKQKVERIHENISYTLNESIKTFIRKNNSKYCVELQKLVNQKFTENAWTNFVLYVEDHLNELRKLLQIMLPEKKKELDNIFKKIYDIYILQDYTDTDSGTLYLFVDTLVKFIETRMFIPHSKVINNLNEESFIQNFVKSSLLKKYLRQNPKDKLFLEEIGNKKENAEHVSLVEDINLNNTILKQIQNIPTPKSVYLLQVNNEKNNNDKLLLYIIVSFMENILNAIVPDNVTETDTYEYIYNLQNGQNKVRMLCRLILQSLMELPCMLRDIDTPNVYKSDVEQMREIDKQKKFDIKDKMSDAERLLYINLEENGLSGKMDLSDFTDVFSTNINLYADYENTNGYNPEYEHYSGENDDDDAN